MFPVSIPKHTKETADAAWSEINLQVSEKPTASIIWVDDGSLFYLPEDGSSMFFRNLGNFIQDSKVLRPEIQQSLNISSENLKFYRFGNAYYKKLYNFERLRTDYWIRYRSRIGPTGCQAG
jgi:hypothetical protein